MEIVFYAMWFVLVVVTAVICLSVLVEIAKEPVSRVGAAVFDFFELLKNRFNLS